MSTMGSRIATAVTVTCAVVMTAIVVKQEWRRRDTPPPPSSIGISPQADWMDFASEGQRIGPDSATAILVVFGDYQCPFCAQLEQRLSTLRSRYAGDLAVVYRHLPLSNHPAAADAAIASECAARQGSFEAMHAELFALQQQLGALQWDSIAVRAGITDLTAFNGCMASGEPRSRIDSDVDAASSFGARVTPIVLGGGSRMLGAPPEALLDSLIQSELRSRAAKQ
jgi:protein-disulfide isomerase